MGVPFLDGEARSYLDPACLKEPAVKEVLDSLLFWLNQFLAESRVRLTSLEEDLKDGMVLKLVLEKLTGQEIELPCGDFVQSRERQATNLEYVLQRIREKTKASLPWKAESILSGDLYAVVSILVIMVRHFQEEEALPALPDLPKAVKVTLLKLVMRNGTLQYEKQAVNLMGRDEPGKSRWSGLLMYTSPHWAGRSRLWRLTSLMGYDLSFSLAALRATLFHCICTI